MLLEWKDLQSKYFKKPLTGVLHVGAHLAGLLPSMRQAVCLARSSRL